MRNCIYVLVLMMLANTCLAQDKIVIIEADHHYVQYYGRFDKTDPKLPKVWAPGAYLVTRFSGTDCELFINDYPTEAGYHSFIEVKVDNIDPVRIQLRAKVNRIQIAKDLPGGDHTVTITKNTDASVGYLEIRGFKCNSLLPPPPIPTRKIEFIGDDVVAGTGAENLYAPCDSSEWYDQSSAYAAYGAVAARNLNAQYYLTAGSGAGLSGRAEYQHLPAFYDKTNFYKNSLPWRFDSFKPDVVVIDVGRNDNNLDDGAFRLKYLDFIKLVRSKNPGAQIVCISVNTGKASKPDFAGKLSSIVSTAKQSDQRVHYFAVNGTFDKGCSALPATAEHLEIASQLVDFVKRLQAW
jgi:lysophospholipase L1-like esterase